MPIWLIFLAGAAAMVLSGSIGVAGCLRRGEPSGDRLPLQHVRPGDCPRHLRRAGGVRRKGAPKGEETAGRPLPELLRVRPALDGADERHHSADGDADNDLHRQKDEDGSQAAPAHPGLRCDRGQRRHSDGESSEPPDRRLQRARCARCSSSPITSWSPSSSTSCSTVLVLRFVFRKAMRTRRSRPRTGPRRLGGVRRDGPLAKKATAVVLLTLAGILLVNVVAIFGVQEPFGISEVSFFGAVLLLGISGKGQGDSGEARLGDSGPLRRPLRPHAGGLGQRNHIVRRELSPVDKLSTPRSRRGSRSSPPRSFSARSSATCRWSRCTYR